MQTLNLSCVYTVRDLVISDTIGINCPSNLAKTFFDASVDPFFRSTITEARIFLALYKSFQSEIDDSYIKQGIVDELAFEDMQQDMDTCEEVCD
jgi:hypothetical protein